MFEPCFSLVSLLFVGGVYWPLWKMQEIINEQNVNKKFSPFLARQLSMYAALFPSIPTYLQSSSTFWAMGSDHWKMDAVPWLLGLPLKVSLSVFSHIFLIIILQPHAIVCLSDTS